MHMHIHMAIHIHTHTHTTHTHTLVTSHIIIHNSFYLRIHPPLMIETLLAP